MDSRSYPGLAMSQDPAGSAAALRLAKRLAAVPTLSYPPELPVSLRRDAIADAIAAHQVIVVAGETGSGKTTQLPKICLELGRGVRGMIGHTQPRRIAARSVAERIADEVGVELGSAIGYAVRFTDKVSDSTLVKVMTDGLLLAEIQRDRRLGAYDTLIIDEAHERSLNVDFLLGYLKRLLPRRPDLKLIITSATIEPQRFAAHFDDAPVIEVSGRTYPVELRYRPLAGETDRDQVQAISDSIDELSHDGPGDVLVFLSGEREIRDTADFLTARRLPRTEVLPLYARLSSAEQHRVFAPHTGRRVVLATNVAETSLTVPGIRYVVDTGFARISRYSQRLKVQRLPIEPVSQASAQQRAGRCGRTSDGICIRLYTEEDHQSRPEYTDPEILRTNLASVILAMTALDLGDIMGFPFLDPPDRRTVKDGLDLLHELGAIDPSARESRNRLTPVGRQLSQLPLDPRLGRMVVEADRNGCLAEVLVITSALSIQDPRERPGDHRQAADARHARFADKDSDFAAYLNLWRHLRSQRKELSSNQFRRACRDDFLHYLRIREWQDVHAQLRQTARELGFAPSSTAGSSEAIHRSLLAGLLSHVGLRDPESRDYLGARGARFGIFPGSGLFKSQPRWVMAAELVETTRLWARDAARIDPVWIEALASHLVKRTYSEPHWEKKRAAVMASERVTLYGIPVVVGRSVAYGRIDPVASRELFIRHALVDGDWDTRHDFFAANRALLEEVAGLEDRTRRRDILVDDEELYTFYDERVGAAVVSGRHFDTWWKKTRRTDPHLLDFERTLLVRDDADVDVADYPDQWRSGGVALPVTYLFEPGDSADGVTVDVPLARLHDLEADSFWWQVPGNRELLVTALIKTLPKMWRRQFVPAPDHARAVLETITPGAEPLVTAVAHALQARTGVTVPPEAFDPDRLPDHLRVTFRVLDGDTVLATGKDLDALRRQLRDRMRSALSVAARAVERTGMATWQAGTIPRSVTSGSGVRKVTGYPALVDEGDSVAVRVLETPAAQRATMRKGTRRLLVLSIEPSLAPVVRRLDNRTKLALTTNPYGNMPALLDDVVACAVDDLMADRGGPVWDETAFARLREEVRGDLPDAIHDVLSTVAQVLDLAQQVAVAVATLRTEPLRHAADDLRAQSSWLVHDGFVSETGRSQLRHLPRYLRAMLRRIERLPGNVSDDDRRMLAVQELEDGYDKAVEALGGEAIDRADVREVRWSLEELRVSLFAQALGTASTVSPKRIRTALDRLGHPT